MDVERKIIKKRCLANHLGFSLVELMVVVAIGGILTLGMSNIVLNMYKNISRIEDRMDRSDLNAILNFDFSNPQTCLSNFGGRVVQPETNLSQILGAGGSPTLQFPGSYSRLQVGSIKLLNQNVPNIANGIGRMTVQVYINRLSDQTSLSPVEIPIHVQLNAGRRIQSCYGLGGGQSGGGNSQCPPISDQFSNTSGAGTTCGPYPSSTPCSVSEPKPHGTLMQTSNGCHGSRQYLCMSGTWAVIGGKDDTCGPGEY